ncbi:unnamed protein product, partial [Rotaria sp. Silwood2]
YSDDSQQQTLSFASQQQINPIN